MNAAAAEQKVVQYLGEAQASENALVRVLQSQIAMTPSGAYRSGLETHLRETREHAARVTRRLEALDPGSNPLSVVIGFWESVVGQTIALSKTPFDLLRGSGGEEKVLKNVKDACASEALEIATSSRRRTITLRDGARVTLRSISPDDKRLLAASFARLSEESRYRRFFTVKPKLSAAELDYFVDVDHSDHEAIIAIDPLSGDLLGVARYIRSNHEADVAEVAVTVADDWQQRGLGRALLDRLTYRARRQGVRKFSALVQSDNSASLGLLETVGDTQRQVDSGLVELVIKLPPKQGIGARLAQALRAAAAGNLAPAHTLTHRMAVSTFGRERLE